MFDRLIRLNTGMALGLCFIILMIIFALTGHMGLIGADNDDVMRMVQIRDFLAGQNWYDHHQYRMGLEGEGTLMHWSRLIDLPVIALITLFDLFLPYDMAEAAAISIWPVVTGLGLILSVKLLSRDNPRFILKEGDLQQAVWGFGILIMGLFLVTFYRFNPGRLDHHNIQLIALALSYVGLSDPGEKPKRFALAGAMTGLSLVIGTEALPFLVVNCGFVALLWAYKGAAVTRAVTAFGVAFSAMLCVGFLMDTPPSVYGQIYCDILAINYLFLGCAGGLGLVALARSNALDTAVKRWVGLGVLGGVCGAILLMMSPQCLSNPLGLLPENAQSLWLDYVEEAQPLLSKQTIKTGSFFYFIGLILTACSVSLWRTKRLGVTPTRLYALALSVAVIVMTMYQIRYAAFGLIIGTLILIPWVADQYVAGKAKSKGSVSYIFAFALSTASLWQIPAFLLHDGDTSPPNTNVTAYDETPKLRVENHTDKDAPRDICFPDELADYLKTLSPRYILAEPNMTSAILYETEHKALNGNYHRNAAGIDKAIEIFKQTPARAANLMAAQNIELLYFCKTRGAYGIYAKAAPKGLAAALMDNKDMTGFTEIPLGVDEELSLWRLND